MAKVSNPLQRSGNKIKIDRVFVNKRNGQITIVLPKKKLKSIPTKVQVTYW